MKDSARPPQGGLFLSKYIKTLVVVKTFSQFREDCGLEENWLLQKLGLQQKPKPQPKPKQNTKVLAYKNYKSGVLDKSTNKFTPRPFTKPEQKRYGWKPVKTSSYGPGDTGSQSYNTGSDNVQRTADGTPFTGSTKGVAVPYKYKANEVPKGTWAGTPSIPFGTKLQMTQKPMGKNTKVTNTTVRDTGNFGPAGEVNKNTSFDLMRSTARDVTGNPKLTPTEYGKRKIYVRTTGK